MACKLLLLVVFFFCGKSYLDTLIEAKFNYCWPIQNMISCISSKAKCILKLESKIQFQLHKHVQSKKTELIISYKKQQIFVHTCDKSSREVSDKVELVVLIREVVLELPPDRVL